MLITFRTMGEFKAQLVGVLNGLFRENILDDSQPQQYLKHEKQFSEILPYASRHMEYVLRLLEEFVEVQSYLKPPTALQGHHHQLEIHRLPEVQAERAPLVHAAKVLKNARLTALRGLGINTSNRIIMNLAFWKGCLELVNKVCLETGDRDLIADSVSDSSSADILVYVLQRAYRYLYFTDLRYPPWMNNHMDDIVRRFSSDSVVPGSDLIKKSDSYIKEHVRGLVFLRELEESFKGEHQPLSHLTDAALSYRQPLELCRAGKIHIEHLILYVYFKWYSVRPEDPNNYIMRYYNTPELYEFLTKSELCGIFLGEDCPTIKRPLPLGFQRLNFIACRAREGWVFKTHRDVSHTAHSILRGEFPDFNDVPSCFIAGFEEMLTKIYN